MMESENSLMMQVIIPLAKIKRAVESENVKNPRQKYVEIVTEDNFEFWFMGFLNHQRTLTHLQQAIILYLVLGCKK
ncbi:hypothetical protein SASPL_142998 [Salvia splendens]|uniref:GRAM domain-containing protein n=1 Tax=Salvia splendens TaxID=180675 RepID=A0A8X8WN01_SALSN|nr:hypothetical protein SASPL_142998 [Salvia splendens]